MPRVWIAIACLLAVACAGWHTAVARDTGTMPVAGTTVLDKLFAELKAAPDKEKARQIANRIWQQWFLHPNGAVQHLMTRAQAARRAGLLKVAMEELDKIVELAPDYAEGWNQRATVLFMLGRDSESVRDIQQVLRLEPRHFGALAGLGLIHMRAENWKSAIASLEKALEVHPFLSEKAFIQSLRKKLDGTAL